MNNQEPDPGICRVCNHAFDLHEGAEPTDICDRCLITALQTGLEKARDELALVRADLEKAQRIIAIKERALENRPLCPDCRDKTKAVDECLRCKSQRLEKQLEKAQRDRDEAEETRKIALSYFEQERCNLKQQLTQAQQELAAARKVREKLENIVASWNRHGPRIIESRGGLEDNRVSEVNSAIEDGEQALAKATKQSDRERIK